ncbi:MAG: hypothetical protein HQL94_10575, partial [Magnetococcales bacterium]|nr:hypothetical protein [Magnetococcales bacterium]
KEIQYHTLFGGLLLHQPNTKPSLLMLTALLHHEWYVRLDGKGYGGLTLFADYLKNSLNLDIGQTLTELSPNDLEIIQAAALVDMVSALEERRSYKKEMDSFKVLIIMNSDAQMGHFNPKHYAAWHRIYLRQNPNLLPLGLRVALPREKERRVFQPLQPKKVNALPLLTYDELERLGFLVSLENVGIDIERIRRRGGLLLAVVEQMKRERGLNFDCSPEAIQAAGITLLKEKIIPEEAFIELDGWREPAAENELERSIELNGWREWLTYEELERSGLLEKARLNHFNLTLIRKEGGIVPARLIKRGIRISEQHLKKLGIVPLKKWTIRLPASESRLTSDDLGKLGITDAQLKQAGCLERVKKVKSGVPLKWLEDRGIRFSGMDLTQCGIDPVRKIFYDIVVVEEINSTRAKFIIVREGDDLKELTEANERNELEAIQHHLFNQIGEVIMDFTDQLTLPDLSGLVMGDHWGV